LIACGSPPATEGSEEPDLDAQQTDAGAELAGADAGVEVAEPIEDAGTAVTPPGDNADAGEREPEPEPGSPASPSQGGQASFTVEELSSGAQQNVPVAVYVPSTPPLAVALFLPGFQLRSAWYEPLLAHLASHGIAVVAADPPASLLSVDHVEMAAQASAALDDVFAEDAPLAGVDAPVFVMGHSLGGKLSVMIASADPRVAGVFAIDPVNGSGPFGYSAGQPDVVPDAVADLAMPLAFVGETVDATTDSTFGQACAPAAQNYATFFDAADSATAAYEWTLDGAGHMDFVDDVSECGFACGVCNESSADPAATRATVRALAVAFVRRHAGGESAMDDWLTGDLLPVGATVRTAP
jgi:pimeloyl-ACP methyl ester carboxylesterase